MEDDSADEEDVASEESEAQTEVGQDAGLESELFPRFLFVLRVLPFLNFSEKSPSARIICQS